MAKEDKGQQVTVLNEGRADRVFFDTAGNPIHIRKQGGTATFMAGEGTIAQIEACCDVQNAGVKLSKGEKAPEATKPEEPDPKTVAALKAAEVHGSGGQPQDYVQAERISREAGEPLSDREFGPDEGEEAEGEGQAEGGASSARRRRAAKRKRTHS